MNFSKMDRNEKIEVCFEFLEDRELITDKMETSDSGVSQARASIKQNMKRNKTVVFNAMLDALAMVLCDLDNGRKRNFKIKNENKEKDRQIENLEYRLSEVDDRMKTLEKTIKEQSEIIEKLKLKIETE